MSICVCVFGGTWPTCPRAQVEPQPLPTWPLGGVWVPPRSRIGSSRADTEPSVCVLNGGRARTCSLGPEFQPGLPTAYGDCPPVASTLVHSQCGRSASGACELETLCPGPQRKVRARVVPQLGGLILWEWLFLTPFPVAHTPACLHAYTPTLMGNLHPTSQGVFSKQPGAGDPAVRAAPLDELRPPTEGSCPPLCPPWPAVCRHPTRGRACCRLSPPRPQQHPQAVLFS